MPVIRISNGFYRGFLYGFKPFAHIFDETYRGFLFRRFLAFQSVFQSLNVAAQIKRALEGDTRAFEALRDTSGEKPTDKVEASVTNENKELMREYLESVKKGK